MTEKKRLEKLIKLADAMYYAAANLGPTVGSGENLRKTMEEYHKFIIHEYHKEEPVSEELLDTTQTITYKGEVYTRCYKDKLDAFACKYPMSVPKSSKRYAKYSDVDLTIAVKEGAKWQKEQMMAESIDVEVKMDAGGYPYIPQIELYDYDKDIPLAKEGDKYKVILIKED